MIVCGEEVYIISRSGQVAEVNAFAKECGVLQIPIVDAAVVFEDPYDGDIYFLVMRNALYVESMDHHLIPPFIMQEAGLVVNHVAKIHCQQRTQEDHRIIDKGSELHIRLRLEGIFSSFPTRRPSAEDLQRDHIECIYLSPADWNPNSDHFSNNEDMLIDFEGRAVENGSSARKVERSYLIEEVDAMDDPISVVQQFQIDAVQVGSEHLLDQEIGRIAEVSDASVGLNPYIDNSSSPL